MVRTVFTDEDKRNLKVIALELLEIRKLVVELTETLVNANEKKTNEDGECKPRRP